MANRSSRWLLVAAIAGVATIGAVTPNTAVSSEDWLRQGMLITQVRAHLIKDGWMPVRVDKKLGDERENLFGDARLLFEAGMFEVESCTGTGLNICFFNYQKSGRCLRLTTQGEYFAGLGEPKLVRWTDECPD